MDNLYWLDQIQPSERPLVGNQAFNLSQLLQRGYPVIPGFVVPARVSSSDARQFATAPDSGADALTHSLTGFSNSTPVSPAEPLRTAIAFWEFIEMLAELEPVLTDLPHSSFHVNVDDARQLQQVAQQIRQKIMAAALPPEWASSLVTAAEALPAPAMILHPSLSLPSKRWQVERLLAQRRSFNEDVAQVAGDAPGIATTSRSHLSSNLPFGKISGEQPSKFQPSTPLNLEPSDIELFGILESHTCLRQLETLALSLKQVWAEVFRARSLFYWQRNDIELQQLNLAVLVQPIWDAIASGTLVANPAEWNIQATCGLGIALTRGEVLPDYYQLQVETGTVQTQRLGSKTLAYRLSNLNVSASAAQESYRQAENGLQAYILSEEQQQEYALDEKYLKKLIGLCQQLTAEVSPAFYLEWTLCQRPGSSEPQLYITQFTPQPSKTLELSKLKGAGSSESKATFNLQPSNLKPYLTPQLVRGLPAASGRVIALAHVMSTESPNQMAIAPGRILVVPSITPDWLPLLKQAAGIVTEQGGMTCHAAIIARELGIPAVVRAPGVTQLLQTGESLLVDGDQGEIHRLGIGESGREGQVQRVAEAELPPEPIMATPYPLLTLNQFPIATQLLVNLSQPESLERIVGLPVDGVGLLRSELMMLNALENLHPSEWLRLGRGSELVGRLAQLIVQFAAAFAPRPVFYRSLDWRSHEFQFLTGDTSPLEPEVNPVLGLRGTRRYLSDPTYFDLELAALGEVYSYGYTNVQLMLPFVRAVEEFTFCRRRVEQAGLTDNPHFQLWIMAEVPSVLFLLPDYVKAGVQGISIGTNDLTQLLLAVDRDQEQLSSTLDSRHPAMRRALKQLIQAARVAGIPCSICGQAPAQYPELIDLLVQAGITSISVDVNDVERTYSAIARAEQRLLLEAARQKITD